MKPKYKLAQYDVMATWFQGGEPQSDVLKDLEGYIVAKRMRYCRQEDPAPFVAIFKYVGYRTDEPPWGLQLMRNFLRDHGFERANLTIAEIFEYVRPENPTSSGTTGR